MWKKLYNIAVSTFLLYSYLKGTTNRKENTYGLIRPDQRKC
mgnify:CR=1 FL=1